MCIWIGVAFVEKMMNCVHNVHFCIVADTISDPMSCDTLAAEDTASLHDAQSDTQQQQQQPSQKQGQPSEGPQQAQRPLRLDILPPPPNANPTRRSPLVRWLTLGYHVDSITC
jgi:hypothetical protein